MDAKNLFRFCTVGGLVALVDLSLIWFFVHLMPRLAAVAVAYILAVTLHFWLNRSWVFAATHASAARQLRRYALTIAGCCVCTVAVTALSLATVTGNVFMAKILALPPTTLLAFFLMRRFVFRPASGAESARCTGLAPPMAPAVGTTSDGSSRNVQPVRP